VARREEAGRWRVRASRPAERLGGSGARSAVDLTAEQSRREKKMGAEPERYAKSELSAVV
jgi:hypothetical protein